MTQKPTWLPALVSISGEPNQVFARLYKIFEADFKQTERALEGVSIRWDNRILEGKYEEGFWHLITKQDQEAKERLLDPRRAERLPWCGPTITNAKDSVVKMWNFREANRRLRTYLWLEAWDYVVILEKRQQSGREIAFLITAFYVEGNSTRKRLRDKYAKRET